MGIRLRLARLGRTGWSITGVIVGAVALVAAIAFLLPLLMPVLVVLVAAATLQPLVEWLRRQGVPPTVAALTGALVVPAALIGLALLFTRMVIAQAHHWEDAAKRAGHRLGAEPVSASLSSGQWRTALLGIGSALTNTTLAVAQLAIGVLIAAYLLFFLFRDGPRFGDWLERRVPMRPGLFRSLLDIATQQFRNYVVGTTIVAALDATVITLGAIVLDLPLVGAIAVITFVAAFIPYVGAWLSAIFAVIVALGAGGVSAGLWMLGIVLVTQNLLEGLLRPLIFGRALGLHPIVVLGATMLGAALAGVAGVFIAPPAAAIIASWWRATRPPPEEVTS